MGVSKKCDKALSYKERDKRFLPQPPASRPSLISVHLERPSAGSPRKVVPIRRIVLVPLMLGR